MQKQLEYGVGFHCHHDKLVEVIEGLSERIAYIKDYKPRKEQELRLRLIRIVPDRLLPKDVRVAVRAVRVPWAQLKPLYDAYWAKRKPLDDAYWAERKALSQVVAAHMPELLALHAQECKDCPWDGETIFPKG